MTAPRPVPPPVISTTFPARSRAGLVSFSVCILRDSVAERPILGLVFTQDHQHVLSGNADGRAGVANDRLVERALLGDAAPPAQGDANGNEFVRARDTQVAR